MKTIVMGALLTLIAGPLLAQSFECEATKSCGFTDTVCLHRVTFEHNNQGMGRLKVALSDDGQEVTRAFAMKQNEKSTDSAMMFSAMDRSGNWIALMQTSSRTYATILNLDGMDNFGELVCEPKF